MLEGANSTTRNLAITGPYGRDYAICTTLQWDFKSSQNTVTLTIEAPKTDATVSEPASPEVTVTVTETSETTAVTVPPPKTPEQMEQEAKDSGWLTVWHEFTWWYPWYRLHLKFHVNGAEIDVGYNPALQGEETSKVENLGNVIVPINPLPTIPLQELQRIVQEMLEASIVDVLGLAAFILAAGNTRIPLIIYPALIAYGASLFGLGYYATQYLYNVGSESAGRAFMAGVFIGLASVLLTTILCLAALSRATIITTNVIFAIIGTLVGNSYDSKPAMDFTRALIFGLLGAIAVSAVGLRLLPFEPIGNTFYFAFLMTTLTAMFMAKIALDGMR